MKTFEISRNFRRKISLRGVFPPIPTPFLKSSELIDFAASEKNFAKWKSKKLSGYVALGTNGQYPLLSESEALEFVKFSVKFAHEQNRSLIAGAGCESTIETIRRCEKFTDAGVDAVLVITPHYYSPVLHDTDYVDHFLRVADKCKVPVILYNNPRYAHVNLTMESVKQLAAHDNIIGIKDSSGNIERYTEIVAATEGEKFSLLSGSGNQLYSALQVGAVGCIAALASVLGDELFFIMKNFEKGRSTEAERMQNELKIPNETVTLRFGVPGLHHAMKYLGYQPGELRSPLKAVSPADAKIIEEVFQKYLD